MKKMLFLVVLALAVTGCSSIQYNNARKGVRLSEAEPLKIYPMQAEIEVGEVIRGIFHHHRYYQRQHLL